MSKVCSLCRITLEDNAEACPDCGRKQLLPYYEGIDALSAEDREFWAAHTDEQLRIRLLHFEEHNDISQKGLLHEAIKRGLLPSARATRNTLDLPFGKMISLAFKWLLAANIAFIPFGIVWLILHMILAANGGYS
jgi:predicted amidophosphoribosyltransferase